MHSAMLTPREMTLNQYIWWNFCDIWTDIGVAMYWQVEINIEAYEEFHYCWSMEGDTFKSWLVQNKKEHLHPTWTREEIWWGAFSQMWWLVGTQMAWDHRYPGLPLQYVKEKTYDIL